MSTEELKAKIVHALDELYNQGNLNVVDEEGAADVVFHTPPFPDRVGREAHKEYVAGLRAAYSDMHATFEEVIGEGNTTVARWTLRGVHTGQSPTLPMAPTGEAVTIRACTVSHWVEGQAVEHWNFIDYFGVMQQLGVVPPRGKNA